MVSILCKKLWTPITRWWRWLGTVFNKPLRLIRQLCTQIYIPTYYTNTSTNYDHVHRKMINVDSIISIFWKYNTANRDLNRFWKGFRSTFKIFRINLNQIFFFLIPAENHQILTDTSVEIGQKYEPKPEIKNYRVLYLKVHLENTGLWFVFLTDIKNRMVKIWWFSTGFTIKYKYFERYFENPIKTGFSL